MDILLVSATAWDVPESALSPGANRIARMTGGLADLRNRIVGAKPEIIFAGGFDQSEDTLRQLEALCVALPATAVILFCPSPAPDFLVRAMRAGVREVLTEDAPQAMADALSRTAKRQRGRKPEQKGARRLGFVAAKGGDGATCIATNYAFALAASGTKRVLMIDLSIPFGDAEMYLTSEKPTHDLADFSGEIERLDNAMTEAMVYHLSDNFQMIPSPTTFERFVDISPAHVGRLIDKLSLYYDFIVMDLGSNIDPINLAMLEKVDELVIVSTLEVPSARRTGQLLQLWAGLDYDPAKVMVAINRKSGKAGLKLADFENAIGRSVARVLPDVTDNVQESLLRGASVVELFPKSPLTRAITGWAAELSDEPAKETSLWRRLKIK